MVEDLTYEEKIETILSILATPIQQVYLSCVS